MRKGYIPSTMKVEDFCEKYGFVEITTKKMEGRQWSNGKINIGWTNNWYLYSYKTGSGVFNHYMLRSFFFENEDKYPAAFKVFKERSDDMTIFEFILGYLDQFPRKAMFS